MKSLHRRVVTPNPDWDHLTQAESPQPISHHPNERQVGGTHYRKQAIQTWDFVVLNNIGFLEGNAIRYLARWREKDGIQDLQKAIHYIEKLIDVERSRPPSKRIDES